MMALRRALIMTVLLAAVEVTVTIAPALVEMALLCCESVDAI
jgi:hypothetical protein